MSERSSRSSKFWASHNVLGRPPVQQRPRDVGHAVQRLTFLLATNRLAKCSAWLWILSLDAPPSVNAVTFASYPYVNILHRCSCNAGGKRSAGQKTSGLWVAHVEYAPPFSPCTSTMSTRGSGWEKTSVRPNWLTRSERGTLLMAQTSKRTIE